MHAGNYVYHTGGWGTGEILEVSPVREQLSIEFENVSGRKHITFSNAFKTLLPLPHEHFLARRFANPDKLEQEAKDDPVSVIKALLRDLGPKTAAEIKDELSELVIPEKEWSKWWQSTRNKLKKDPMVQTPENLKDVFKLLKSEVSHEEQLHKAFHSKTDIDEIILTTYNFMRDQPKMLKKKEVSESLFTRLNDILKNDSPSKAQEFQILVLLEDFLGHKTDGKSASDIVSKHKDPESILNAIEILALKKKALTFIREHSSEWVPLFCALLPATQQSALRDYIFKELNQDAKAKPQLLHLLKDLVDHPVKNPDLLVWYFQKITSKDETDLPYGDKEGKCRFFDSFLILFSAIESKAEFKDLTKKMYTMLLAKRYALVRALIEGTSIEFIKEFLLLVSKCQTFTDHDQKILRSLAEVVHPTLSAAKKHKGHHHDANVIWTTEAGYLKTQERAKTIGTVEIVENAREIEAARALGDLRENSEYKFALERRSRLQGELKMLSDQLSKARLITPDDISPNEVGVGSVVTIQDHKNHKITYTILGPWDADTNANVLSFQSKLAQALCNHKVGDTVNFKDEDYKILAVKSYLDK
jgi:transcription elongation factor GreA-like protein/transcription elongation GreA/GreB family factor